MPRDWNQRVNIGNCIVLYCIVLRNVVDEMEPLSR